MRTKSWMPKMYIKVLDTHTYENVSVQKNFFKNTQFHVNFILNGHK